MWAFITSNQELYFYQEGYIRTSSEVYKLESKETYIHLTNQCLQIHGKNYGLYETGNTISFPDFQKYLSETYPQYKEKYNFERDIIGRIKDIIIDTYLAVKSEINQAHRTNSYELLGYDFMIDEDFRIWLIEVNSNPYLGIPTKYIGKLLPQMIEDLFQIVLDPIIKSKKLSDRKNKFELLYSEKNIYGKGIKINKRRPFKTLLYPMQELVPRDEFFSNSFHVYINI